MKHSICKSLCLPGHTVHHSSQLSCIPPQRAGEHFPLCPRSSAAGPRDRADRLACRYQRSLVFRVSHGRDVPPCPTWAPPRQHVVTRWTLDTVLASPTLWGPFVLSDPGLLICFQTGSNTSCGGNVQGDTVTGPECVCVCVNGPVMRSYIHCNECEARVPEHSLTLCADLLNDSLGWMCLCCLGQRFSLPNIIMWFFYIPLVTRTADTLS